MLVNSTAPIRSNMARLAWRALRVVKIVMSLPSLVVEVFIVNKSFALSSVIFVGVYPRAVVHCERLAFDLDVSRAFSVALLDCQTGG